MPLHISWSHEVDPLLLSEKNNATFYRVDLKITVSDLKS